MTADDYYNQGVSLSDAKNYSAVLTQLQKAMTQRVDFAEAYNMIGFTYRMLGRVDLSLQNYKMAAEERGWVGIQ